MSLSRSLRVWMVSRVSSNHLVCVMHAYNYVFILASRPCFGQVFWSISSSTDCHPEDIPSAIDLGARQPAYSRPRSKACSPSHPPNNLSVGSSINVHPLDVGENRKHAGVEMSTRLFMRASWCVLFRALGFEAVAFNFCCIHDVHKSAFDTYS